MTQGARNSNRPQLIEDLDVLVSSRMLRPAKVKLGGREWTIKRDFTPDQIFRFWGLVNKGETVAAFTMLVGIKDAQDLTDLVDSAPIDLITQPLHRLYRLAGLLKRPDDNDPEDSDEGESSASSPGS